MQKPSSIAMGTCGLCKAEGVALCNSDLLPKAVVRWTRMSDAKKGQNPNPVIITQKAAVQVNFRVAEYFLCPTCEDRLIKGGESSVLRKAYRGGDVFGLRDALKSAPALTVLRRARVIDARSLTGVDIGKLVYFAASIFWKAGAREWRAFDHYMRLNLGPYEERFRQFLMQESDFPKEASLVANVSGNATPHVAAIFPYYSGRMQGTRQYRFAIPGLAFWLHIGHLPDTLKAVCASRYGLLFLAPELNETYVHDMGPLVARAKVARSLR